MSDHEFSENQTLLEKLKCGYNPMIEGVRWSEKYSKRLEAAWSKLPKWMAKSLFTIIVFVLASGMQGEEFVFNFRLIQYL